MNASGVSSWRTVYHHGPVSCNGRRRTVTSAFHTASTLEPPAKQRVKPAALPAALSPQQLPRHVAVITDGNRRWAMKRAIPTGNGHRGGVDALMKLVKCCRSWDIPALTVFGFSTENWRRDSGEVAVLMSIFDNAIEQHLQGFIEQQVRFRVIGCRSSLPASLQATIQRAEELTEHLSSLNLTIALDYGGRQDITAAARKLASLAAQGLIDPEQIDESTFSSFLATAPILREVGEPDLMIRTSGEQRISNFLLWELAHSEMVFTDLLWPDFDEQAFAGVLQEYSRRSRRFGGK